MRRSMFRILVFSAVFAFVALSVTPALAKPARAFGEAWIVSPAGTAGYVFLAVTGADGTPGTPEYSAPSGTVIFDSGSGPKLYTVTSASFGISPISGFPAMAISGVSADGARLPLVVDDGGQPGRKDIVRTASGMIFTRWTVTAGNLNVRL